MGPGCGDMHNFWTKILNYNFWGQKGPERAFVGRKRGGEAARGDAVERCGRKKVAGGPYGLRGKGFGPFWAAGPAGGDTLERGGRKKVAGGPYGLRGEGFGPFCAARPAEGRLYWILERLY